ncbi:MAG: MaoC family dehydratase [Burkholderiaceae bacterium]
MKFAEFEAGQIIDAGSVTISEQQIIDFAKQFDPQWFHTDPRAAGKSRWNGLIASGWHTCSMAMRLLADNVLAGSESFASPGLTNLRWKNPVRPGDTLHLQLHVNDVRRARSRSTLGVVQWKWQMNNQCGDSVLELDATSMFDLHDGHNLHYGEEVR